MLRDGGWDIKFKRPKDPYLSHGRIANLPLVTSYLGHPEADTELKKPPDQSEITIWRNFRKICISIRTKTMLRSYIKK